jgi:hypothetical protein
MRYESILEVSGQVADAKAVINRYLYTHRFCGMTLNGIDRIAGLNAVLCVVAGGAWCWYFYSSTGEMATGSVYITVACTLAFALALFDKFFDASHKHEVLENIIEDYLKNIYEPRYLKSHNISSTESVTRQNDAHKANVQEGKNDAHKANVKERKKDEVERIKEPLPEIALTDEAPEVLAEDTETIIQEILNWFL